MARPADMPWPRSTSEMARRMRTRNWAATPLGPVDAWPPALKDVTELMLAQPVPAFLIVGAGWVHLYNDSYAALAGRRHPEAFGEDARLAFQDADFAGRLARCFTGESLLESDRHYLRERGGASESAWFDLICTPVRDETGAVLAVLALLQETTARRLAQQALCESEERFHALFESIDVGVAIVEVLHDDAGHAIDLVWRQVNAAYVRQTGLADLVGRRYTDVLAASFDRGRIDACARVIETGVPEQGETYSQGTGRWIKFMLSRVGAPGSRRVALVFEDISERKRAEVSLRASEDRAFSADETEAASWFGAAVDIHDHQLAVEALKRSEAHFRLVAENVTDYAIFMMDAEGRLTDWFPGAAEVYEWQAEEIIGKPFALLFTPEDRNRGLPQRIVETARAEGVAPDVGWHIRKDGRRRFIDGRVTALRGSQGGVKGFVKIGQDITARFMAETALTESEARFRQFGEASSDVLWIRAAADLQTEYVSPAFEEIYGTRFAQLFQGDNFARWIELIHPDDRSRAMQEVDRVRHGEKVTFEYRIRRGDGSIRWLRDTDFPLRDADGRIVRIGGIGQDITEQKEAADRMKVMVAELHHRTRNLIGVVQSIANQTMRSAASTAEFLKLFTSRLRALANVQDLLSPGSDRPITLEGLLRTELHALATGDLESRVSIAGPAVNLKTTAVQVLALAIHELATNARKYGALLQPEGRLKVLWRLAAPTGGEPELVLEWTETGVPVPPDASLRRGYGRQLVERALPRTLGGEASFDLASDGLRCVIVLPLSRIMQPAPQAAVER